MSHRSKPSNLIEASNDLQMALRCIRELAKQRKVGKGVWEAAWDWQDEAHKRWCKELSEMGHVSPIATARCDHLTTYDRKAVAIPGERPGLQRTPSSEMET
jgi:predicted amidohydrolase YtcJ